MNRRAFVSSLISGVVVTAAARIFPFRIFSFPSKIRLPNRTVYSFRDCNGVITTAGGSFADHVDVEIEIYQGQLLIPTFNADLILGKSPVERAVGELKSNIHDHILELLRSEHPIPHPEVEYRELDKQLWEGR
jgi:hypothetical protein